VSLELITTVHSSVEVPASPEAVFEVLASVSASGAHFPELVSLTEGQPNCWTWEFKKLGAGRLSLQTLYACRYSNTFAEGRGRVEWEPVLGVGNGVCRGSWTVEPGAQQGGSRFTLDNHMVVTIGLPGILRMPAQAMAIRENDRLVGIYLDNLARTFRGGQGRLR
jgi:Polyketide cyclase / dehydrase and lipid transport